MLDRFRRNTSKPSSSERLEEGEEDPPDRAKRKDSGCNWRLSEDEDEVRQVRHSNPGIARAEKTALMAQGVGSSPTGGISYPHKEISDILIPAGASLLDGLRLLLVHHLRASAGTENINLTAGQAELLEHHLSRLSSYAQKIVHTLAFATRFLSSKEAEDAQNGSGGREADVPAASGIRDSGSVAESQEQERRETKRSSLRLKDRELLEIYREAQQEASREADWRGLATPRTTARSNGSVYSDSSASKSGVTPGDAQLLRVISEAMQQPGRTPEIVAAEIVQSSSEASCHGCQSQKARAAGVSATVRWPRPPPDPGRQSAHHD